MDTITQITLGAAIGEAFLGNKIGNKAPVAGAALGVVPDLDILASPFVDNVQEIALHRGITHSLLFAAVASLAFGWLLSKYLPTSSQKEDRYDWTLMVFTVFITHIFIDVCTSYGTQVFQPFSDYSLSFNSVFIIDPFYTLPLFAGLLGALLLKRGTDLQKWINYAGLGVSTCYLLAGLTVKSHVNSVFEQNFNDKELRIERYMTTPAPFSIFLWSGYAVSGDSLYVGLYSIFDTDTGIDFEIVRQNSRFLDPYKSQLPVERLRWFSNGYYKVEKKDSSLIFTDMRFGRSDLWLTTNSDAPFVWSYKLKFNNDSTKVIGFTQYEPSFDTRTELVKRLIYRIFGRRTK